jgi:hypothetical protein
LHREGEGDGDGAAEVGAAVGLGDDFGGVEDTGPDVADGTTPVPVVADCSCVPFFLSSLDLSPLADLEAEGDADASGEAVAVDVPPGRTPPRR